MRERTFRNRQEAGRRLAAHLGEFAGRADVIVLALPRGGVPIGREVARALEAPLDVFVVRKLGVPGAEELAMGAIASGGVIVLNEDVVQILHIPRHAIDTAAAQEKQELERRERLYRGGRSPLELRDRIVILVDDGLATGASMLAAIAAVRAHEPRQVVVAVPVASPEVCENVKKHVDQVVCLLTPAGFSAVGHWYEDFSQTSDAEVGALLAESMQHTEPRPQA